MYHGHVSTISHHSVSFTALRVSCALPIQSFFSSPKSLKGTGLFTLPIVLPFPKHLMVGTIQYTVFSDWLFSLNLYFKFFHVVRWFNSSRVFMAEYYSTAPTCHSLLFMHNFAIYSKRLLHLYFPDYEILFLDIALDVVFGAFIFNFQELLHIYIVSPLIYYSVIVLWMQYLAKSWEYKINIFSSLRFLWLCIRFMSVHFYANDLI